MLTLMMTLPVARARVTLQNSVPVRDGNVLGR